MKPGTHDGRDLRADLLALVPDETRVTTSESVLDRHAEDFGFHRPHLPDAVVYPTSVGEVASVLSFPSEHRVPLVPFGAGTSLEDTSCRFRSTPSRRGWPCPSSVPPAGRRSASSPRVCPWPPIF